MPQYKLHYFGVYARAEPSRQILAYAKADWEDCRYSMEEWPNHKASMPRGQVPCLELADGTKLGESVAIARFLANSHGLYPQDKLKAYHCDRLVDASNAYISTVYKPVFAQGDEAKAAAMNEVLDDVLPKFLDYIEPECAKAENFIVGDISLADFYIGGLYVNYFKNSMIYAPERWAALLEKYPGFKAYGERFAGAMAEYLASRPPAPV